MTGKKIAVILLELVILASFVVRPAQAYLLDPFVDWFRNEKNREDYHCQYTYADDCQPPPIPEFGLITGGMTVCISGIGYWLMRKKQN